MTDQPKRCPRCSAALIIHGAVSRTTRECDPEIEVCGRCDSREAYMEERGELVPFTEWPLSVEQLVAEERIALTFEQAATIELVTIDPDAAREMLDDDDPEGFGA